MDIAYSNLMEHKEYISSLKSYMIDGLNKSIDGIYFNGDSGNLARSLYTILSVSFPPTEISSMLLFNMDIMGFHVQVALLVPLELILVHMF